MDTVVRLSSFIAGLVALAGVAQSLADAPVRATQLIARESRELVFDARGRVLETRGGKSDRGLGELLEAELVDGQGKILGRVKDFYLSLEPLRVTHVIVAPEATWKADAGWLAIPYESVKVDGRRFVAMFATADVKPAEDRKALPAATSPLQALAAERDVRLSKLIGASVRNGRGEALGHAADLLVDVREWRVLSALVAAKPGASFAICRLEREGIVIEMADPAHPGAANALRAKSCAPSGGQPLATEGNVVLATQLMHAGITDPSGEEVGTLRDVVVRARDAALHYFVADFAASWVQDGKLVALPLRPLATAGGRVKLEARLGELQRRPILDERQLADVWSPAYAKAMERYLYANPADR